MPADLARPEPRHALEHPLSHRLMGHYAEADEPLARFQALRQPAETRMRSPQQGRRCPPRRAARARPGAPSSTPGNTGAAKASAPLPGTSRRREAASHRRGGSKGPRAGGHLDSHFPPSFYFICLHCPFSLCLFPSRCSFARFTRRVPLRTLPRRSQTWSDLSPGGPP